MPLSVLHDLRDIYDFSLDHGPPYNDIKFIIILRKRIKGKKESTI